MTIQIISIVVHLIACVLAFVAADPDISRNRALFETVRAICAATFMAASALQLFA